MRACEAVDLELAVFVGGSAVVWSSSLRWWTKLCVRFEIVVVVGGVTMPCRALAFNFLPGLPIMTIFGRVGEKETAG
jgi:hypothetical protein